MKKYSKLILVAVCAFFISITPSFARELKDLNELEEYLEKAYPNRTIDSFYLIGEYAFTSNFSSVVGYGVQDTMLSTRSIKVVDINGKVKTDAIYNEMTIQLYQRLYDSDWNPTGIKLNKNVVGTTNPTKLNIKYIDYEYVPDESKATVAEATGSKIDNLKTEFSGYNGNTGITVATTNKGLSLSGTVHYTEVTNGDALGDKSGYYFGLDISDLSDEAVVCLFGATGKKCYDRTNPADAKFFGADGSISTLIALHPEMDAKDKIFKITVDSDGQGNLYDDTEYKIDYSSLKFEKQLDVDSVVGSVANVTTDDYAISFAGGKVTVNVKDQAALMKDTTGPALQLGLGKLLKNEDVKSITLTYNGKDYALTSENLSEKVEELLKDIAGKDYNNALQNDLINSSLSMKIQLKDTPVSVLDPTGKSEVSYTVEFTGTKLKESEANISLLTSSNSAYTETVKNYLDGVHFEGNSSNIVLTGNKLTGTVDYTSELDKQVFTTPTGYYFAYVVEIDKTKHNITNNTKITISLDGETKTIVGATSNTENSAVVLSTLKPDATNKVITIVVDIDGDGGDYLPTTYTIDYSELVFVSEILEDALYNLDQLDSAIIRAVFTATESYPDANTGIDKISTSSLEMVQRFNVTSQTQYVVTKVSTEQGTATAEEYTRIVGDKVYNYYTEDGVAWYYTISNVSTASAQRDATKDMDMEVDLSYLLAGYRSIKFVNSDIAGATKLEIIIDADSLDEEDGGDKNDIVGDIVMYVYVKDNQLTKMTVDYKQSLSDAADALVDVNYVVDVSGQNNTNVKVPDEIISKAQLVEQQGN